MDKIIVLSSCVRLDVSKILILVRGTWDVLCWGDCLTAGLADMLRQWPNFDSQKFHVKLNNVDAKLFSNEPIPQKVLTLKQ